MIRGRSIRPQSKYVIFAQNIGIRFGVEANTSGKFIIGSYTNNSQSDEFFWKSNTRSKYSLKFVGHVLNLQILNIRSSPYWNLKENFTWTFSATITCTSCSNSFPNFWRQISICSFNLTPVTKRDVIWSINVEIWASRDESFVWVKISWTSASTWKFEKR